MKQWTILRKLLSTLGLSAEQIDDLIATIQGWLGDNSAVEEGEKRNEPLPYRLRNEFLSAAELSFYHVLRQATGEHLLLTKVNLGDLFYPQHSDRSKWRMYRNKIDRKHVDFLVCNAQTLQPVLGIELDDKSHKQPKRQQRDSFVDDVFAVAGLPLIHVPAAYSYNVAHLAHQIDSIVVSGKPTDPVEHAQKPPETMVCPKCSAAMQRRTARRGPNAGNQFWGCTNYPTCRGVVPI